jgi:hypothetical protein
LKEKVEVKDCGDMKSRESVRVKEGFLEKDNGDKDLNGILTCVTLKSRTQPIRLKAKRINLAILM